MDLLSIILIAIGLAMDCFAVAITQGISQELRLMSQAAGTRQSLLSDYQVPQALLMASLFGLFQGGMPLLGFFAGVAFTEQIAQFDHWIALILLSVIGGKMIWESLHEDEAEEVKTSNFKFQTLFLLAIATSIDALATGVIFVPTPEVLWQAVSIIAIVSFLFSGIGYTIGIVCGKRFHFNVELLGGIILIAIGAKIFIEHMWY